MAIGIANFPNINTTDPTNYPDGIIRDAAPGVPPTPVNVKTNGDIQMFFDKIIRNAGITPNNTPDNEGNGYQLVEAAKTVANVPIEVITRPDMNGDTITFDKSRTIIYTATTATPNTTLTLSTSGLLVGSETVIQTNLAGGVFIITPDATITIIFMSNVIAGAAANGQYKFRYLGDLAGQHYFTAFFFGF